MYVAEKSCWDLIRRDEIQFVFISLFYELFIRWFNQILAAKMSERKMHLLKFYKLVASFPRKFLFIKSFLKKNGARYIFPQVEYLRIFNNLQSFFHYTKLNR
jgi:hypothetical protein